MKEAEFDIRLTAGELYVFSMHHTYSAISGIAGLVISFGSLAICAIMYLYMSPVRAFIFPKSQCGGQFDTALDIVNEMMDKYKDYEPEEEDNIKEEESVSGTDRKED